MNIFDRLQKIAFVDHANAKPANPANETDKHIPTLAALAPLALAIAESSNFKNNQPAPEQGNHSQQEPLSTCRPIQLPQFDLESLYEQFAERAAIMEYDGGLSREDAERMALDYILEIACQHCGKWGVHEN